MTDVINAIHRYGVLYGKKLAPDDLEEEDYICIELNEKRILTQIGLLLPGYPCMALAPPSDHKIAHCRGMEPFQFSRVALFSKP